MDKFEKIYEASINGTYEYEDGTKSGRALAYDEHEGIRDVTDGKEGQGDAEVDKSGIYLGVPYGRDGDETAWVNPAKAEDIGHREGNRARIYQAAYDNAPEAEKKSLQDWSPEHPDLKISLSPYGVKDNVNHKLLHIPTEDELEKKKSSKVNPLKDLFKKVFAASNQCA